AGSAGAAGAGSAGAAGGGSGWTGGAELEALAGAGAARVAEATSLEELRAVEAELLGKRSALSGLHRTLGQLEPDQRRTAGAAIGQVRARLAALADARREELGRVERAARFDAERLDLTEVLPVPGPGHLHLVTQTRDALEDVFVAMGFTVAEGPEVESDWYNFEALGFERAHPARAAQDNFYLRLGEPESVLLRTHTSPMQVRLMETSPPPLYVVVPGRVYRRDTPDARHLSTFHQVEGLVVDHGITFGDLAGTIEAFTGAYFGADIHSRLRPASFPFTEPSAEFEVTCTICRGEGCRTCSNIGWIELGGCGMVDPAVFANVGIDAEEWSGFAFGFGIDRLVQIRYGLSDIRVLSENDIRFLSQV
ncbi:MAG: phenylalanine--tRNA ligase subunit alpha, partial [Acidimicrobiales bacterium]